MTVLRIAAFSDGDKGGNPAGIWIGDDLPPASKMQAIAADVGFSETAFAAPEGDAWRVRYFSPLCEVPFCGHATIALGAALALQHGDRTFELKLNHADISVAGRRDGQTIAAALQSPPTRSAPIDPLLQADLLQLLDYSIDDLDLKIPPAKIHGGADHVVLALKTRNALARMSYDLERGRELMEKAGLGHDRACYGRKSATVPCPQCVCRRRRTRGPGNRCSRRCVCGILARHRLAARGCH